MLRRNPGHLCGPTKPVGEEPIGYLLIEDARYIPKKAMPRLKLLTYFRMAMIESKPWVEAAELEEELGLKVIAASNGMKINLESV